jgi:hypothetical protein
MIEDIQVTDEDGFLRNWSGRAFDHFQLAQISLFEQALIDFAQSAWRSMRIPPPTDKLLITACEEGLVLMSRNGLGEWRTSGGLPHRPPRAWMPCPLLPAPNGAPLNGRP